MTIGIYKLIFNNTDKIYIGQSIHIEVRLKQHVNSIKYYNPNKGTKLYKAIRTHGIKSINIIEECDITSLNSLEILYITKFNSFKDGFNSTVGGDMCMSYGEDHPASKLLNEDYIMILWYLSQVPTYTLKQISSILEVSEAIVENISSGTNHNWLIDKYPEIYENVYKLRGKRRHYGTETSILPILIESPEGVSYEITGITDFCLQHKLHRGHLRDVLKSKILSHNGWHLPGSIIKKYPEVKSPNGIIYNIPFGEMKKFTVEHNLSETLFRHLLQGRAKSHKGWKLA